ncbi:ABC transporter permease [Candidatus Halocynthiibacter alkanivorans]|uniref:ABC transporter permease n=1 Tax=Candidatus Halocynthiibacter alkanivorans TaxID=2267619 RepID=UPI000DF450D4|nr:ABC transporter permease [Candidatus Halocynthiibacter alkanivorans]
MDFELMWDAIPKIAAGIPTTLLLAFAAVSFGFVIAICAAIAITTQRPVAGPVARSYIYLFRSTPLLIQLFLIYFGLGQSEAVRASFLWPVLQSPMWCAIIALALNTGAFSAEIFRGALSAVPNGQMEAARAGGMSWWLSFRRIQFPVGMRIALPSYGNELIMMIKATALASTVTVLDVTGIAQKLISATYKPIEIFIVAGAFYLIMNLVLTRVLKVVENRVSKHL